MHTLHEFLEYTAEKYRDLEAYLWLDGGRIVSRSFIDLRDDAAKMASMLHAAYGRRRKIALIGDMSYSWICAYYGIMNSGNVSVPVDTKLSLEEIAERLSFADVSVVFLSDKYAAFREGIGQRCRGVEAILTLEDYPFTLPDSAAAEDIGPIDPDALSSLMFTSGTSGDGLKAAMINQRAILADVTGPVPLCVPGDRLLSLLPIHHCFEIFVGQMKYLYLGGAICVNDSMANLVPNLSRFGITIVVAVPALANMLAGFIGQGLKTKPLEEVKQMLGGRLRRITIGGACVSKEVIHTLGLAGITVFVGYGLTETAGGCLANCDASIRPLSAGAPYVEGMEMKLDDGELCLRGPMVMMGYYKSPSLTAKVMEGDWFHTGDLAEITEDNYVIIHGRKDNMIKTPNGEKVYPENWENRLSTLPGVGPAMVCAFHDHLTAVLFLKEDTPALREKVASAIDQINAGLPNYEKILDIRFRDKPFPMTTSLKIRRGEVMKDLMQGDQGEKTSVQPQNDLQRRILAQAVKALPRAAAIGIDDNLFDCGLDSLSTIHLAMLLNCDPGVIYACKTVRKLSECVRPDGDASHRLVSEGMKIAGINRYIQAQDAPSGKLAGTVLLTGASGYLGVHLLSELIGRGGCVVCLVRSAEALRKACVYFDMPALAEKAETLIGDITKAHLGLDEETYNTLCGRIDAVVHAAALVSHVGSEEESYRVNVEGTREVLRLCEKSKAQLYHMSSYAVAGFRTDEVLTEDALDIGQEITENPYIQTKYQAEEQVLLAREKGVASAIFRIGNLTERASDGKFQINAAENGMAAQLRAIRALGVYPESMADVPYDHTAVDEAARAIVLLAAQKGTGHIWHIMNPNVAALGDLTGAQQVADPVFALKLAENSADRDAAILSVYYRMRQNGFNTGFRFDKTQRELTALGFAWSK